MRRHLRMGKSVSVGMKGEVCRGSLRPWCRGGPGQKGKIVEGLEGKVGITFNQTVTLGQVGCRQGRVLEI